MKNSKKSHPKSRSRSPEKDEKINFSDIPETDEAFWASAKLQLPKNKKGVFLRVDPEVLNWFQKAGKGYQTRINAVLRSYMEAHSRDQAGQR